MTTSTTIGGGTLTITQNQQVSFNRTTGEWKNANAFAAIKIDGSVVVWGAKDYGGDISSVSNKLNGTIDVTQIYSSLGSFAALRVDGSVITWGIGSYSGNSNSVSSQLDGTIDVTQIYSTSLSTTQNAFAALRIDGSVITWGDIESGGDSRAVAEKIDGTVDVTQIYSNKAAFAALRADGSVVTWGRSNDGGYSGGVANQLDGTLDVTQIYSNKGAFAALRSDGSVVTWGDYFGGDSSKVANQLDGTIDVVQISSTAAAFAALRADGSVVTWGDTLMGGGDSSSVASQLDGTIEVIKIFSTEWGTFAALRADGSVVTWGGIGGSGGGDSSAVASQLDGTVDVVQIYSTADAFAALRADGSVITWGDSDDGGDSRTVYNQLDGTVDVIDICRNYTSFAALRADGSVVTWGDKDAGGNNYAVANQLDGTIDVSHIYSTGFQSFAALRVDGSVVTWGDSSSGGGDSRSVTEKLKSGVVSLVNPATDDFYTAPINYPPTGNVSISGIAQKNQTLNVNNTLVDANGLGIVNYQWLSDGVIITGANQTTYALTQTDVGKNISVSASYTDGLGKLESATSSSVKIANVNDAPTGNISISGTAQQNQTLMVTNTLIDSNGLGVISYQWLSNGKVITGATNNTYTLTENELGTSVSVEANYVDLENNREKVTSNKVFVDEPINYPPTGDVTISGTPTQNETLIINNTIADANGLGTLNYQWLSNELAISGATQTTYALTQTDVGKAISVKASYIDGLNNFETVTSSKVTVTNVNDLPTGSVLITGTAKQGEVLTASNSLVDADGLGTISYQWLSNGAEISGANQPTYTLSAAEVGKVISAKASYIDLQNTAESVISGLTVLVAAVTPVAPVISSSDSTIITPTFNGLTKIGDAKNNTLIGANKNDDLSGLAENDTLLGKVGNDRLNGGEGKDSLTGGLGFDELTGGAGLDKFIFTVIKDAPLSRAKIEIITDFNHKEGDKIDLSTIDANADVAQNQAFTKPTIGAEFSGNFAKAGQLFFDTTDHVLYGTVNNDGAASFAIQLNGVSSLVASDFIL